MRKREERKKRGERREEEAETPHTPLAHTPVSETPKPQLTPPHQTRPWPSPAPVPNGTDPLEMALSGFMPLMTAGGASSARMTALAVAEV